MTLDAMTATLSLNRVLDFAPDILDGQVQGRVTVTIEPQYFIRAGVPRTTYTDLAIQMRKQPGLDLYQCWRPDRGRAGPLPYLAAHVHIGPSCIRSGNPDPQGSAFSPMLGVCPPPPSVFAQATE